MKIPCASVALELLALSMISAAPTSPVPATIACPVSFDSVEKDTAKPPIRFSLVGTEGLATLEVAKPSESGFFVASSGGAYREASVVEFQVDAKRPTMRIQPGELSASLAWSTAVSSGSKLVGNVSPGPYRLILTYVSPESPSPGKAQRLCMAISQVFDLSEAFTVHRFE